MKIDPSHLEILAAIVDRGGLIEGANALGKSQPSVSRSLAILERRLGVDLFEPNRRPLRPTEICLSLAQEGQRILDAGQNASALVSRFKSGRAGGIRIAGTPLVMDGVVAGMIAQFQAGFPGIRIDQSYGYSGELLDMLDTGAIDLGIVPILASEVPSNVRFHELLKGRNVIACRVGHPLSRKSNVRLCDIAEYSWITPPAESPLFHDLRSVLDGIGMKDVKVSYSGGSLSAIMNVLGASDALTVLPYSVVFNLRRQNAISALSIRIGNPDRHIGIISNGGLRDKPAAARLARFIESEFSTLSVLIQQQERNAVWRG